MVEAGWASPFTSIEWPELRGSRTERQENRLWPPFCSVDSLEPASLPFPPISHEGVEPRSPEDVFQQKLYDPVRISKCFSRAGYYLKYPSCIDAMRRSQEGKLIIYHGTASSQSTSKYVLKTDGVQNIARSGRRFEFIILRSVCRSLTTDKNRNASSHPPGSREAALVPRAGSHGG